MIKYKVTALIDDGNKVFEKDYVVDVEYEMYDTELWDVVLNNYYVSGSVEDVWSEEIK